MKTDFLQKARVRAEKSGLDCHLVLIHERVGSLRLAHSQILQPTSTESFFAYVKLGRGSCVASGQAEGAPQWALERAWQEAEALLEHSSGCEQLLLAAPICELAEADLPPLPSPGRASEFVRGQLLGKEEVAGMLQVKSRQLAVINSLGLLRTALSTQAHFFLSGNGFAELVAPSLEELGEEQLDFVASRGEPLALPPGRYRVLLGPSAALDLVEGISHSGFGGREYLEGASFLPELKILGGDTFTLADNWQATGGLPFDFEGTTRSCPSLVEGGKTQGPVTDLATARRLGTKSSGHSLPPWEDSGPLPLNLVLAGGRAEDPLASLGDGLYIPRFHYLGLVNPKTATFTGTIRDCLLVEGGRLQRPVVPLRFTASFLELAQRIEERGKPTWVPGSWGTNLVPPLILSCFTFAEEGRKWII